MSTRTSVPFVASNWTPAHERLIGGVLKVNHVSPWHPSCEDWRQDLRVKLGELLAEDPNQSLVHNARLFTALSNKLKDLLKKDVNERRYLGLPDSSEYDQPLDRFEEYVPVDPDECSDGAPLIEDQLSVWDAIEALPDAEMEVIQVFLAYNGATQQELADLVGISLSTVKRRLQTAFALLAAYLSV